MEDFSFELPLIPLPFQVLEFEDGVVLKRGLETLIISGPQALQRVLLILTLTSAEPSSSIEIKTHFPSRDHDSIDELIKSLFEKRFLVSVFEKNATEGKPIDIFYQQFGLNSASITNKLSKLHFIFCGINSISSTLYNGLFDIGVRNMSFFDDPLLRNFNYLNSKGIQGDKMTQRIVENTLDDLAFEKKVSDNQISVLIATSDFGGQSLLLKWNAFCLKNSIHFYPIYIQGLTAYAGPVIIPGETPCLDCVRHRQNAHLKDLKIRELIELNATNAQTIIASHPAIVGAISNISMFELIHFYGGFPHPHPERFVKLSLAESKTESKKVLKIPRCPSCSNFHNKSEIQLRKMTPMQKR